MFSNTIDYLTKHQKDLVYEFVLVNDGSPDETIKTLHEITNKNSSLRIKVVNSPYNAGKGYAVRTGMAYAQGKYILMLDADGATDVHEIGVFLSTIKSEVLKRKSQKIMLIGSRSKVTKTLMDRPWYRRLPSLFNNFLVVNILGVRNIDDTQCGFKIFTQEAAKTLFSKMHLNRWAFDVELLLLAQK